MSVKLNTPYQGRKNGIICLYCGEIFTAKIIYEKGYNRTLTARKQLESHYMAVHYESN